MKRLIGNSLSLFGFTGFAYFIVKLWIESEAFTHFSFADLVNEEAMVFGGIPILSIILGMTILVKTPKQ